MSALTMTPADRRWAAAVKERDNYPCRVCHLYFPDGWRVDLHAHHIFTRGRGWTRTDPENGVSLCMAHHTWAHDHPMGFQDWIEQELGSDAYVALRRRSLYVERPA